MTELFRGHDVKPGVIYQDANVKVTAVENTHFHFEPGSPAYGKYHSYRIVSIRRVALCSSPAIPARPTP